MSSITAIRLRCLLCNGVLKSEKTNVEIPINIIGKIITNVWGMSGYIFQKLEVEAEVEEGQSLDKKVRLCKKCNRRLKEVSKVFYQLRTLTAHLEILRKNFAQVVVGNGKKENLIEVTKTKKSVSSCVDEFHVAARRLLINGLTTQKNEQEKLSPSTPSRGVMPLEECNSTTPDIHSNETSTPENFSSDTMIVDSLTNDAFRRFNSFSTKITAQYPVKKVISSSGDHQSHSDNYLVNAPSTDNNYDREFDLEESLAMMLDSTTTDEDATLENFIFKTPNSLMTDGLCDNAGDDSAWANIPNLKTFSVISQPTHPTSGRKNEMIKESKGHFCPHCSRGFKSETQKRHHIQNKHIPSSKKFICSMDGCTKSFVTNSKLKAHQLIHSKSWPEICEICNKGFVTKATLKAHQITKHCDPITNPWQCETCQRGFSCRRALDDHLQLHTKQFTYKCNYPGCDFGCSSSSGLNRHSTVHEDEKSFACDSCCQKFKYKRSLVKHMKIHKGEKRFSCSKCDKSFFDKYKLNRHSLLHEGNKKFACSTCDKSFYTKDALKSHAKIHHKSGYEPQDIQHVIIRTPETDSSQLQMPLADNIPGDVGIMPHEINEDHRILDNFENLNPPDTLAHLAQPQYPLQIGMVDGSGCFVGDINPETRPVEQESSGFLVFNSYMPQNTDINSAKSSGEKYYTAL